MVALSASFVLRTVAQEVVTIVVVDNFDERSLEIDEVEIERTVGIGRQLAEDVLYLVLPGAGLVTEILEPLDRVDRYVVVIQRLHHGWVVPWVRIVGSEVILVSETEAEEQAEEEAKEE